MSAAPQRRPEIPYERALRRRTDRLFTFDRALLIGAFSLGVWVATADLRHGHLAGRVAALETRQDTAGATTTSKDAAHDQEIAVIHAELRYINENLRKLAEATARLANNLPDDDAGRAAARR